MILTCVHVACTLPDTRQPTSESSGWKNIMYAVFLRYIQRAVTHLLCGKKFSGAAKTSVLKMKVEYDKIIIICI